MGILLFSQNKTQNNQCHNSRDTQNAHEDGCYGIYGNVDFGREKHIYCIKCRASAHSVQHERKNPFERSFQSACQNRNNQNTENASCRKRKIRYIHIWSLPDLYYFYAVFQSYSVESSVENSNLCVLKYMHQNA